jgi:PRTRC genetic system protein A
MAKLIGYLVDVKNHWREEDKGLAYNYILAANGLFVEGDNKHITACVKVADATVRGLPPLQHGLALKHGKIPARLFDLAFSVMLADPYHERYVGIIWNGVYQLYVPEQDGSAARVEYATAENVVLELHSHPDMPARFSSIDDRDEQGLKIYGVVGLKFPEVINLRVGVYGYWMPVECSEIFDGRLSGVIDKVEAEVAHENEQ